MTLIPKSKLWRAIIILGGFVLLIVFAYGEEDWRGKRAWEKCKLELKAKGEVIDWNAYIPPPVPDDQNFFKAPKMAEWFAKNKQSMTNELVKRLENTNVAAVVIAELTVLPASTNGNAGSENTDFRYSSFGAAVFLPAPVETNMSSASFTIPLIQFEDVPVTTAIEALARQAGIAYSLDPKIGYGQPDQDGQIKIEPAFSISWTNITARQALLATLNKCDLQLIDGTNVGEAHITMKTPGAKVTYFSPDAHEKLTGLYQNVIGASAVGSQGFALLAKPSDQIKPMQIIFHSETVPAEKEIIQFFTDCFPNDAAKLGSPRIHVESAGTNSFRVVFDSASAKDYLTWSHKFESEFQVVREALKRPYARMDGNYDSFFSMPIPNYVAVRAAAQTLAQRAQCHLVLGQPEQALYELTLLHVLSRLLEARPTGKPMTLVAAMINVAVIGLYTDTIADGMRLKTWHEPQLTMLQKQLEEINLPPFVFEALREERAGICSFTENRLSAKPTLWQMAKSESQFAIPRGWLYQNLVNLSALDQKAIDSYDPVHNVALPDSMNSFERGLAAISSHFRPYTYFVYIAVLNFSKAMQTTTHHQTMANEAQIVCALERYRIANGKYPETLTVLMPQFIEKIPHDLIGGKPLIYSRKDDQNFLLYSIGWNETDDGGFPGTLSDVKNGDWVWQYQPK